MVPPAPAVLRCAPPLHRLDEKRQRPRRQRHGAIDDRRPDKAALLQPLGEEAETAAVPVQRLEIVAGLAAEQEQMTGKRIRTDDLLRFRGQALEPVPQVDRQVRKTFVPGARLITVNPSGHARSATARTH